MKSHDLSGQRFSRLVVQQKCAPPKKILQKESRNLVDVSMRLRQH
ncbi:hypothetical protein [Nostoc sp. C052]|nr:hypothetical protein [Nostoc sp. C052]